MRAKLRTRQPFVVLWMCLAGSVTAAENAENVVKKQDIVIATVEGQQADTGLVTTAFSDAWAPMPDPTAHVQAFPDTEIGLDETCRKIARKLSSVKLGDCLNRGMEMTTGKSVNGQPILLKEYPAVEARIPLGRVLLLGGIHGDEYSSVSIVFNWMRTLDKHHSGLFHWHVVPLLNPDGLLRTKSQRMNENGVDLNRNFPTPNWEEESHKYWVGRTRENPRRYPGPNALSEPESQWLAHEIEEFKPDAIVSIHAPYGILDFDGPREAPRRLGHLHLNLLGTYPGSLGNYAGVQKDIPVITIELPYAGIMPTDEQMSQIWTDLIVWLKRNMEQTPVRQAENAAQTDPS